MIEALQTSIARWLQSRKHRSLKQLSEETGLAYGTVRNIAELKAVPNGETVLRILMVTEPLAAVHEFFQEYLPHLTPYTKALSNFDSKVMKPFAVTRKHCEVLLELTFSACTLEQLVLKFGPNVDAVLDDLLQYEAVKLEGSRYVMATNSLHFASQHMATELSRVVIDSVNINRKGNMILVQGAALTLESTRELYRIIENAQNEIIRVMNEPNNQGDQRVAVSLAMTIM